MSQSDCCSPLPEMDACGCAVPASITRPDVIYQESCPHCQTKGKKVALQTVKAIVLNLENVLPVAYRFCKTVSCPVVYFSEDASTQLSEADLRERVHQKHPEDDSVLVCYCFQHSPQSIREQRLAGQYDTVEQITTLTKTNRCACDMRNPQGSCCLGNVRKVVKSLVASEML